VVSRVLPSVRKAVGVMLKWFFSGDVLEGASPAGPLRISSKSVLFFGGATLFFFLDAACTPDRRSWSIFFLFRKRAAYELQTAFLDPSELAPFFFFFRGARPLVVVICSRALPCLRSYPRVNAQVTPSSCNRLAFFLLDPLLLWGSRWF